MKKIALTQLDKDSRNANVCREETLQKLERHIAQTGLYPPLIVRPNPDDSKRFILIDGHHRLKVLRAVGKTEADCIVWDVDDIQAQLYLATLNRLRGEDNPRKRAELLDSLCQSFKIKDLAPLLPETPAEIEDLLTLVRLDEAELMKQVKSQLEKTESDLPVLLNFVLNKKDATLVEAVLAQYQPDDTKDPSKGLVALCEDVQCKEAE